MAPCYNWVNDEGEVTARLNKFVLGKQSSRACGSVNVYYLSSDTTVEFFSRLLCCCCFPPFLCCLPGILAKCIICQRPTSVKMQLWDISLFRRAMLVLNIELLFVILNHFWFFFSVRIWVNGLKMPVISCQVGIENMANNPEGSNNDWTISKKLHRKFASFAPLMELFFPLGFTGGALQSLNDQSLSSPRQFCCISCHVFFFSVTLCLLFSVWNQSWSKVSASRPALCLRLTRRLFACFHLFPLILSRTLTH